MLNTPDTPQAQPLWHPSAERIAASRMAGYQRWLQDHHGLRFDDYAALHQWSIERLEDFWRSVWDHFEVTADGDPTVVLEDRRMPGARWFPHTRLNLAEQVFRQADATRPAMLACAEGEEPLEVSWDELARATGALAATLRSLGVKAGDRVASCLPNRHETVVAFLACASLGAVWSSCAPEMGSTVVLDRFRQIEPTVLLLTDSYRYNGRLHDRTEQCDTLIRALPTVRHVVHVAGPAGGRLTSPAGTPVLPWSDAVRNTAPLQFERVPFAHPLWILYSSGTTGLPKAIVHGHGGMVLTFLKTLALQHDVRVGDRMLFLASTGWVVWNLLVGGLLTGATIVLYDGHPSRPDGLATWRLIERLGVTLFGCGAAYLTQCMKDGLRPVDHFALASLRAINATGSPLPEDGYRWVYSAVKQDVWLASVSGGTDIAGGFVSCAPSLPVVAGEIQCRELGVDVQALDEQGRPRTDEIGELVVRQPMPSMPLFFWNDPEGRRYREAYFEHYPGLWRHGDWIRFTPRGSCVIYGRSDSTINRHGIRMGTAEIYGAVEALPEVRDSVVVDLEYLGRPSFMPLFVVLQPGLVLDEALKHRIETQVRTCASSRHVPDEIVQVDDIPRTLTGKKMEVPLRRLLLGTAAEKVASPDAMQNPASLAFFIDYAGRRPT